MGLTICVVDTHMCHFSVKATTGKTQINVHGCFSETLFTEKALGQIWHADGGLPTLNLTSEYILESQSSNATSVVSSLVS